MVQVFTETITSSETYDHTPLSFSHVILFRIFVSLSFSKIIVSLSLVFYLSAPSALNPIRLYFVGPVYSLHFHLAGLLQWLGKL